MKRRRAVVITDALPANVTFASCSNGCTQAGGVVTWNLGNQNIGASGSVTVAVNGGESAAERDGADEQCAHQRQQRRHRRRRRARRRR